MPYLMGIDIGSTSIKAIVYDEAGRMISKGGCPTPLSQDDPSHPSWCVWEPERLWQATAAAMSQAVTQLSGIQAIAGVAVTGFGMDGLPLDKGGNALYPLISWHCPRTEGQAERFGSLIGRDEIFRLTGKQAMTFDSIYRMMWIKENHPDIMEKTDKWLLMEDYINYRLCGIKATDYSMACTTSVFDPATHTWVDSLINAAGIPRGIFPEPVQSGTVIGNITASASQQTGLKKGTPVMLGGHDYICAALAVGNITTQTVMNVTGTWDLAVQTAEKATRSKEIYDSGCYIESHAAKGKYCYAASGVCGDMLEWFKDQFTFEQERRADVWEQLMQKASDAACGSNGCFFLPHFSGAYAPHTDSRSLGAFIGLSNGVTRSGMIRAMIEGVDYQLRSILEAVEKASTVRTNKILCVGGATNNAFWMQNKADVTGKTIEVPDVYEATPLGAALLAGMGAGVYTDEKDAIQSMYRRGITYEPNKSSHECYCEYYECIYKQMQGSLACMNHDIYDKFKA